MFDMSDTGGVKLKHFFFDKAFEEGQKIGHIHKAIFYKTKHF